MTNSLASLCWRSFKSIKTLTAEIEYAVEGILDHGLDDNGRMKMLVRWAGYDETTWEFEDELTNSKCYSLVSRYRLKCPDLKDTPTCLKRLGGADLSQNYR